MVEALDYVTLFVTDLTACVAFYRDALGLAVLEASPSFVLLTAGNCRLGLHATEQPRSSDAVNLHFRVADVDLAHATLVERGARSEQPPRNRPWGIRAADFRDPAGYAVELVGPLKD
ncbi:MAG TPA: VOC family protein [Chloroflexota bacterium]|jgi:catechol 2,3-dioxygenase-like lactoylglutathione lyase family enzyme